MIRQKHATLKHCSRRGLIGITLVTTLFASSVWANEFSVTDDDFPPRNEAKEELGKLLFFDKILSGNKNISCATCHHPLAATSDGLSLPVGEGARGLGVTRDTGSGGDAIHERVPRNSPHIFNLGAMEFTRMFHDGRVEVDDTQPSGFLTPAGDDFPLGLDNVLAAQAMFPVTSGTEMAGQAGENKIGKVAAKGKLVRVWKKLAKRLRKIPKYVKLFKKAFPADIRRKRDITYVHAANAIAAFEASAWRCTNSKFDQFVNSKFYYKFKVFSKQELHGAKLFYDKAGCGNCHSGKFQTDHQFHAIGVPQIGAGKGDNLPGYTDGHDDFGRERVTNNEGDRFKFRTPTLRQVALTGPWGHDGAYNSLESMVRHHLNPVYALHNYDTNQAILPSIEYLDRYDFIAHSYEDRRQAIADAIEIEPVELNDKEISALMAFLYTLTDFECIDLRKDVPVSVPSGLPMWD